MPRAIPPGDNPRIRCGPWRARPGRPCGRLLDAARPAGRRQPGARFGHLDAQLRKPVVALFVLDPRFPARQPAARPVHARRPRGAPAALRARRGVRASRRRRDEVARFCQEVRPPSSSATRTRCAIRALAAAGRRRRVASPSLRGRRRRRCPPRSSRRSSGPPDDPPADPPSAELCLRPSAGPRRATPGTHPEVSPARDATAASGRPFRSSRRVAGGLARRPAGRPRAAARFVQRPARWVHDDPQHPEPDATSAVAVPAFGRSARARWRSPPRSRAPRGDREAFIEELVVRRELAVNLVRCNPAYDRVAVVRRAGRCDTLARHRERPAGVGLRRAAARRAETHDPLWNAASARWSTRDGCTATCGCTGRRRFSSGPGRPRPRWPSQRAERLLRTRRPRPERLRGHGLGHPRQARSRVGPERPVFGTVRYMSFASTSRKFDSKAYKAGGERDDTAHRPCASASRRACSARRCASTAGTSATRSWWTHSARSSSGCRSARRSRPGWGFRGSRSACCGSATIRLVGVKSATDHTER